jgi:hypothetical protein
MRAQQSNRAGRISVEKVLFSQRQHGGVAEGVQRV